MANTLNLSVTGNWNQGNLTDSWNLVLGALTLNAQGQTGGIQNIGTSEENLNAGDLTTNGFLFIANLDPTNYVDWGMSDSGTMKAWGRLKPGLVASSFACGYVGPGVAIRLKANTSACNVLYKWLND